MRDWSRIALAALPSDDPRDAVQADAHKALGEAIRASVADFSPLERKSTPAYTERVSTLFATQAIQLLSDAHWSLIPRQRTFLHAHGASNALRTLVDLFSRQMSIWEAASPEDRLTELQAKSLRQEVLALDAAAKAGANVSSQRAELQKWQTAIGGQPDGINITDVLEKNKEHELLTVYRWESAHVHAARAAVEARARSLELPGATLDVALVPPSLWRVGQLTWATYGVGLRLITFLCSKISLTPARLLSVDDEIRPVAKRAADRPMPSAEPASPPYSEFSFPLWNG